jgi:hypothetical protein
MRLVLLVAGLGATASSGCGSSAASADGSGAGSHSVEAGAGASTGGSSSSGGSTSAGGSTSSGGSTSAGSAGATAGGAGGFGGGQNLGTGGLIEVCLPCGGLFGFGGHGGGGGGGTTSGGGGVSGGSAGSGGTEAVDCSKRPIQFPSFDRSCSMPSDCVAAVHQLTCCGTRVVTGIKASELARFNAAEMTCESQYPACGCAEQPMQTDTGQVAAGMAVAVECQANVCTTYLP